MGVADARELVRIIVSTGVVLRRMTKVIKAFEALKGGSVSSLDQQSRRRRIHRCKTIHTWILQSSVKRVADLLVPLQNVDDPTRFRRRTKTTRNHCRRHWESNTIPYLLLCRDNSAKQTAARSTGALGYLTLP